MSATLIVHWSHKNSIGLVGARMSYQLYDYTARSYNANLRVVDRLNECSIEGISIYSSLDEALRDLTGTVVCLRKSNDIQSLKDFKHPETAVYVIGPDYAGYDTPSDAVEVSIDTPGQQHIELWSHVIAGIVLYDRQTKV